MQHGEDHRRPGDSARCEVSADQQAPAAARAFVQEQARRLTGRADPDLVLLTSEVVTNVVSHTSTDTLGLEIEVRGPMVRVEVWDDDDTLPELAEKDPTTPGGFGMRMVDELASRWGVITPDTGGKGVWFECPAATA